MSDLADFLAARIYDDEVKLETLHPRFVELRKRFELEIRAKKGILLNYVRLLRRYEAGADKTPPDQMPLRYLADIYASHPGYPGWQAPEPGTVPTFPR
jgi:hypothetical protein